MEDLTQAQQVFAVFYAIFFGLMLQTIGAQRANSNKDSNKDKPEATLNLFDTPNAWVIGYKFWNKPLWRYLLSITFLNILPALIFGLIFIGLYNLEGRLDLVKIVVIVLLSLVPHYIYRIYLGILVLFTEELYLSDNDSTIYSKADEDARAILGTDRVIRKDGHKSASNHFAIPCLWIFPLMIILYDSFLLHNQINDIFIITSYGLIILGLILFFSWRKDK